MKRVLPTAVLALVTVIAAVAGFFAPGLIGGLFAAGTWSEITVETEPLSFSGSGGGLEILSRSGDWENMSEHMVEEGYNYTAETAQEHAREEIILFLETIGCPESAKLYREEQADIWDCEAEMVVAAEYPSPWSAIIWNVWIYLPETDRDASVQFDDASGEVLGIGVSLLPEEYNTVFMDPAASLDWFAGQLGAEAVLPVTEPVYEGYGVVAEQAPEPTPEGDLGWFRLPFLLRSDTAEDLVCTLTQESYFEKDGTVARLSIMPEYY